MAKNGRLYVMCILPQKNNINIYNHNKNMYFYILHWLVLFLCRILANILYISQECIGYMCVLWRNYYSCL